MPTLLTALSLLLAQATDTSQQAAQEQLLFRNDKVYSVLAVVLIIWIGVVLQLIRLNRRVNQLERRATEQQGEDGTVQQDASQLTN
jgi:CcmD family protein